MTIDNKFYIGDVVYLKTDIDQQKRFITSIQIRPDNALMYELGCGDKAASWHYDFEISNEFDALIKLSN